MKPIKWEDIGAWTVLRAGDIIKVQLYKEMTDMSYLYIRKQFMLVIVLESKKNRLPSEAIGEWSLVDLDEGHVLPPLSETPVCDVFREDIRNMIYKAPGCEDYKIAEFQNSRGSETRN